MKVTNNTAYATIGCDVQLTEDDRIALGIELDKIINHLGIIISDESKTEALEAINKIVTFVSKFAIRPSQSNVFTDSPEEFKKAEDPYLLADKTTTTIEPAPEDSVITVDISNHKDWTDLAKVIYNVTDASIARINDTFNSAKKKGVSCISFRCMNKRKEDVVDTLVGAGYKIVPNGVTASLRL